MLKTLVFCSLLMLMSCDPEGVEPAPNLDGDLESVDLAFELLLEGSNSKELCGIAGIDSTETSYRIFFDKRLCTDNVKRNGVVEVSLTSGKSWSEKNAVMKISYTDYEIEIVGSGSGATNFFRRRLMTGDQYVENITGGVIGEFVDGKINYVERKTRSKNLSVLFNDNVIAQRYEEASVREFRREGNITTVVSRGDTIINEFDNVLEWGVDVYNQRFYRIVESPIVKTLCESGKRWKFTQGTKTVYNRDQFGNDQVVQKIFGVKQTGEPDGTCDSYGFKILVDTFDGEIKETIYKY